MFYNEDDLLLIKANWQD